MRERDEVVEKFRELRARMLRERKQEFMGRTSMNCAHNARMRVKGKGQLGFCQHPEVLSQTSSRCPMFVCNGSETAFRCKVFESRNTDASVERDFDDILRSPARCGGDYPKLAMLIWFLQEFDVPGRKARLASLARRLVKALWGLVSFRWW